MSAEALLVGLVPAALELAPKLFEAIKSGDRQAARDLAEESARRQAFEVIQREKSAARKKK